MMNILANLSSIFQNNDPQNRRQRDLPNVRMYVVHGTGNRNNPGINPHTGETLPRGIFYRGRPNVNVGTIGHVDAGFISTSDRVRSYSEPIENSFDADAISTIEQSQELEASIDTRRNAEVLNENLSQQFNASDQYLFCPILQDFPQIPVRFNGRLYDYESLLQLEQDGFIFDPISREKIRLTRHVIQPDYDAQKRMDELHLQMRQSFRNR